jgi:hypothetical protein
MGAFMKSLQSLEIGCGKTTPTLECRAAGARASPGGLGFPYPFLEPEGLDAEPADAVLGVEFYENRVKCARKVYAMLA